MNESCCTDGIIYPGDDAPAYAYPVLCPEHGYGEYARLREAANAPEEET